jgi:light-harvesting complex I chlorophyll a/b binding protein 3
VPPFAAAAAVPPFTGGPWFNLFNLGGKSEAEMKKLKLNEIKNGRLAMLAVFGYGAQVGCDA